LRILPVVVAVALALPAFAQTLQWRPWTPEAFDRARALDRPVLLLIDHANCHDCEAMARESFSERDVVRRVEAVFVPVRVDRDARPDIDALYRTAARVLTGENDGPLLLVLTPAREAFFATGYLPPDKVIAMADRIEAMWKDERDLVRSSAATVTRALRRMPAATTVAVPEVLAAAFHDLSERFDGVHGGFLPAPKFPEPQHLLFLLRYWHRTGDARALSMVETTLASLRRSTLRDPLGFGFHRYALRADWTDPQYEKTLYDQALLALAYSELFQATRKQIHAQSAREIFTYVLRDLRASDGAFHAAQSADETYYTGGDRTRLQQPARDPRTPADWNGLMIAALAFAASALEEPAYARAAEEAAAAVLPRRRPYLDDYAFLVWGLLNLYEATFERRWLESAIAVERESLARFRDSSGRFFVTPEESEPLLVRPFHVVDRHVPSGSSVQLMNLARLAQMTGDAVYESYARGLLRASAEPLRSAPSSSTHFLSALMFLEGPAHEIVLTGDDLVELRRAVFARYQPNKVVVHRPLGEEPLASLAPFTNDLGEPGAYVCIDFACRGPVTDPAKVWAASAPKPQL
jgi:uncharacterized protein YyaL (SSP411 family)